MECQLFDLRILEALTTERFHACSFLVFKVETCIKVKNANTPGQAKAISTAQAKAFDSEASDSVVLCSRVSDEITFTANQR